MKKSISFTNRSNLGAGAGAILPAIIPVDVPFLVKKLTANSTVGNFSCQTKLGGRPMSLGRIQQNDHFGVSNLPCVLTAYGYVPAGSEISLDFLDLSGFAQVVEVTFDGITGTEQELAELSENFKYHPYFYAGNIALAGGQANSIVIQTEADYPFRAIKLMSQRTGAFDSRIDVNGDYLTRQYQRDISLWGTAQLPLAIDPYDVAARSKIQIDVLDTSGLANAIECVLMGHKVLK